MTGNTLEQRARELLAEACGADQSEIADALKFPNHPDNMVTVPDALRAIEAALRLSAGADTPKRLIGWRSADYLMETADPALARNWQGNIDVLPIFEGDPNTKLAASPPQTVPEDELIALVAGPYHYNHKMDEAAEREGKAFDRCRELTIQNIRIWCATRRAMLAAAPRHETGEG